MRIEDGTVNRMRCILRLYQFYFSIIHCPAQKHQVADSVSLLRPDTEPNFPSNDIEIPNFDDGTALAARTRSRTS